MLHLVLNCMLKTIFEIFYVDSYQILPGKQLDSQDYVMM